MYSHYSEEFKKRAVQKYLTRGNRTVHEIAKEIGATPVSIYQWAKSHRKGLAVVSNTPRRPEDFSPIEKFEAVFEFNSLPENERGDWLRRTGLTGEKIAVWKDMMQKSFSEKADEKISAADKKKIKTLEKEIRRKDRALAETAALLILQKKISAIYGLEDES